MKKTSSIIVNFLFIALILLANQSCERDFASVGSSIIGSNNFSTDSIAYPVITFNRESGPVQTNSMPSYLLGYHNDPLYGDISASFLTQVTPTAFNPSFGNNVVLDSVVMTIPFYSNITDTDEEGNNTFDLDSVFGSSPIRLSVYRSNYFMRDFNPELEFDDPLYYYSDKTTSDGNMIDPMDLEGELLYTTDTFVPSNEQIILTEYSEITEQNEVTARIIPSIRVKLDNPNGDFWENTIFAKEGEPELSNESNWLDYFRGIYIKAEAVSAEGTLMMMSFDNNASISIHYTSEVEDNTDGGDSEAALNSNTYSLTFSGNKANFYETNYLDIPDGDEVNGDENLYIKGTQGSMAVINLFNGDENGESVELDEFKSQNWLINQAHLIFKVNQDLVQGEEPDRVYIYDLKNNIPLIDYIIDQSASATQITGKIDHLKPLRRVGDDPDGEGIEYKIEITEHINNIFEKDSTNVKLGLVVTTNVNAIDLLDFKEDDDGFEKSVSGSVLSHRGTVLYGNNTSEENKVELKIFYTEPDN